MKCTCTSIQLVFTKCMLTIADFPIPDSVEPPYIISTHTAEIFTADCTHHNYVAEL